MEKDKKVTALYCRLSKDDGSNSESLSIRTQKSMLMEYATRNGFGNCQYYVDDGYSGTNSDRPAFQELLDDIREGKVATVITKDQSRLGRNHIETGTYMEIFFPEHGVRYIAINDGYDSNEQSQMDIAPFRNIINEMYAKDTSRKIKSALRTRKKSGKYISSGAPFGYQKDPADHNHLVIDPNTAPVVEYIYSMAEEGLGLHRIAKRLHDEKVLKPCYYKKEMFGRFIDDEKMYDWDSAYISQVLHSPVYAGHIIYEAKPTVSMKSKKRRYIPFEERAIVPNTHEAIIPQDRWENVQRILYSRSSSFMCDKTDYDNIFKGIVRCADCGRTMLVKVEHRRKRNSVLDQTFYCCSTYRKYGAKACDSHNLEARVLHEAVFADIQAHAKAAVSNREALVKKIANQMHLRVSSDRAQHKRDLKQCKARIAEIEDLYQLTTTKESNIRDVDVAPEYMDFLKEYYKYWKSQKKLMGGSWQKSLDKKSSKYAPSLLALRGTDFVICNDHGFPINPDSYGALVRRIGQRAGIEGLHPHMFRHTFVSILLSNPEIGVATVAAEAGHAQPSTTLAIYTQVYDKRRKEIRNQMSKELYE